MPSNLVKILRGISDFIKQKVLKKFNKKGEYIKFREETIEKGKGKVLDPSVWKGGTLINNEQNPMVFTKVEKILPRTLKNLKEARGYVVADYQEFLERKWMEELTAKYKVEVNQQVLKSIFKK